jgi:hypothetical protein
MFRLPWDDVVGQAPKIALVCPPIKRPLGDARNYGERGMVQIMGGFGLLGLFRPFISSTTWVVMTT